MVDWVHCNKCLMQLTKSTAVELHITNCGHLFCVKCIGPGQLSKCLVCDAECSSMPLSSSMNSDVAMYFKDVKEISEKCIQVIEFQSSHRAALFTHISKELHVVQKKYELAKAHIKKMRKVQSVVEKDLQTTKDDVTKLKREVVKLRNDNEGLRNTIKMSAGSSCPAIPTSQAQQPDMARKLLMPSAQLSQLTLNRLTLPRPTWCRTPKQFNDSMDRGSSYKKLSNFSGASGGGPLNMSGQPLQNSKTSLSDRK